MNENYSNKIHKYSLFYFIVLGTKSRTNFSLSFNCKTYLSQINAKNITVNKINMRTLQGKKSSKAVVRNVSQISVDAGLSKYPLIVTGRSIDVSIFEFSGNIVFIILLIR